MIFLHQVLRNQKYKLLYFFMSFISCTQAQESTPKIEKIIMPSEIKNITITSEDSLIINGQLLWNSPESISILMFHQAGSNLSEFDHAAKVFYDRGYNVLRVDLRSGGDMNNRENGTHNRALEAGLKYDFLASLPDMRASIQYFHNLSGGDIILMGSSYTAGLSLYLSTVMKHVKAVIAYSPGEYYGDDFKLAEHIADLQVPIYVTAAKHELNDVYRLMRAVKNQDHIHFYKPITDGNHGSKVLWPQQVDNQPFWDSLNEWIKQENLYR